MSLLKQVVFPYIFSKLPPRQWVKLAGLNFFIPYYHMVSDHEVLHIKHLYPHKSSKQFIDDLDYLLKHFTPIALLDLISIIKNQDVLPPKAFHLTFDDGFREMHDIVAPILLEKGIPATFFINSAFTDNFNLCYQHKASLLVEYIHKSSVSEKVSKHIDNLLLINNVQANNLSAAILAVKYSKRHLIDDIAEILDFDVDHYLSQKKPYLTTDQINSLIKNNFTIGAHSIDHPLYKDLSIDEQLHQTIESVSFVRDKFGLNYSAFAFPHSDIGVPKQYFDEIEKIRLLDISFGTAGLVDDCVSDNIQRFSLESPLKPASKIFPVHAAKSLWRKVQHVNKIVRQ